MNNTMQVPFFLPSITTQEKEAVLKVMDSHWLTTGNETLLFEQEFSQFVNVKHALAVNSASSGLILALDACGVTRGDTVITSPYTFVSTATAILHRGANIAYVDIEKDSYNIDPDAIEQALQENSSVKAIIVIHIAGLPCNMEKIIAIAKKYGVFVIEDSAHAFPSKTKNGYCGTIGDIGIFSFYATKTITTAEGGMVCTNNDFLAKRVSLMRMHGIDRPVWNRYTEKNASWRYDIVEAGYKYNMPDILASIGRVQLQKAHDLYTERKKIAEQYTKAFITSDKLICPPNGNGNAWHLYLLRIKYEQLTINRDEFAEQLQKRGIGISVHFIPHYEFTYFKDNAILKKENFPNTQKQFSESITLPLWAGMSDNMISYVITVIFELLEEYKRSM